MTKKIETISTIFLGLMIMSIIFTPIPSVMAAPSVLVVDLDGKGDADSCDNKTKASNTIQSAVNAAKIGNTIIVCGGTYNEAVVIDGKNAKNLTVMAADGEMVIVYGKGAPAFSIDGQGVTLKGFIAQSYDGKNTPEDSCIISVGNNNQILDNIANNCKHGIYLNGQNTLVSGNEASYNENNGITTFNHKNDNNNKFIGNTANNNGAHGFYITGNNAIIGTLVDKEENEASYNGENNQNIHVWGNGYSIRGNMVKGGGTGIYVYGNNGDLTGNTVADTGDKGMNVKGSDLIIDSNKSTGNGNTAFSLKGNNNTLDFNELIGKDEALGLKLTGNDNSGVDNNISPAPQVDGNNNDVKLK